MPQHNAEPHGLIAEIRKAMAATAEDPPSAGLKLMMSAEDVAAIIPHATADTVRDKHRQWTKKNGFPAPMPGMSPLVWSGPQVMAWLRGTIVQSIDGPGLTISDGPSVLQRKYGSAA